MHFVSSLKRKTFTVTQENTCEEMSEEKEVNG